MAPLRRCFLLNSLPVASRFSLAINHYFPSQIKTGVVSSFHQCVSSTKLNWDMKGEIAYLYVFFKSPKATTDFECGTPRLARLHLKKVPAETNMPEVCFTRPVHIFKYGLSKHKNSKSLAFKRQSFLGPPKFPVTNISSNSSPI